MQKDLDQQVIKRIVEQAKRGEITRRDFLGYSLAAGVTAASASSLWSGNAIAAPRRGGTCRFGIHNSNTTDSHDPGTYINRQHIYLAHQHRSYLTLVESDNSLGSDLATSWSANPAATQWTFELNPNATFHSGRKVEAKDVIASINHHRGEKSTSAAKPLVANVKDISAKGKNTVVMTLDAPNADLPWIMTDYHMAICPANDDGTLNWQSGDGSGPYKIDEGEFGVGFKLSRHDGWHLKGAYFDKIEFICINDPNARQTALLTGDVDAVSTVELKTLALLKRNKKIAIDNVPSAAAITMPMLCDVAPFDDVRVRQAFKLAMDRDEVVKKIAFGNATIGNDYHIAPNMPYWPDIKNKWSYDPDRAKSLLKKAGHDRLSVNLSTAPSLFSGAVDLCVLYSEQAKKAGLDIKVVREPDDGFYSDVWLKKPFCAVSWGARPTPDMILTLAYKSDAAWNESHWKNERFDTLLAQARGELDDTKRAAMYYEMAELANEDGGTLLPFFNNFVYARSSKVKHTGKVASSWELDGARAPSRWWFEA